MTILSPLCRLQGSAWVISVLAACYLTSCAQPGPQPTVVKTQAGAKAEAKPRDRRAKLERQLKRVQEKLSERDAELKELQDKNAKLTFNLLEKEAQIEELEEQADSEQVLLDEAILEVVRAKAKLRSLESRAEAASNMAEAEIALRASKEETGSKERGPEVAEAEELLRMSAVEFEKGNYGGALYLSLQAKSHIQTAKVKLGMVEEKSVVKGEVVFAQPLPLRVLKRSNLRQEPSLQSRVLTVLGKGVSVVGYSYKGEWVRVKSEDGTAGWIYQLLVGGR